LPFAPAANAISPTKAVASASTVSLRMSSYSLVVGGSLHREDDVGGASLRCAGRGG
jgi:hypothetical protein